MLDKIIAFFSSVLIFFLSLFGINGYSLKYELRKDVRYGSHERNVMDVVFPKNASGDVGLVLYIHGGGWIAGDKGSYLNSICARAKQGYVAASMNYRYTNENVDCSDILDDITAALAEVKRLGAEKGINVNSVLLTGHSAGGHLSLLYAYSKADEAPVKPVAVVDQSGPTELARKEAYDFYISQNPDSEVGELFRKIFSNLCGKELTAENYFDTESQELLESVSPLYYVNGAVPTVICHGVKDSIVPYSSAVLLDNALTECGVKHELVSFPNSDHGLESDPESGELMAKLTDEYIAEYLTVCIK